MSEHKKKKLKKNLTLKLQNENVYTKTKILNNNFLRTKSIFIKGEKQSNSYDKKRQYRSKDTSPQKGFIQEINNI